MCNPYVAANNIFAGPILFTNSCVALGVTAGGISLTSLVIKALGASSLSTATLAILGKVAMISALTSATAFSALVIVPVVSLVALKIFSGGQKRED